MNRRSRTRLLVAAGVILVVLAAAAVSLYVVQRQGAYYCQVSELSTGRYDGRNVKVGGRVLDGSIRRDADGVHFDISDLTGVPAVVAVTYDGQMPSAFAAGVDVVVTGRYATAGTEIAADQLQTKCPSKYEGQASPVAQPGQ